MAFYPDISVNILEKEDLKVALCLIYKLIKDGKEAHINLVRTRSSELLYRRLKYAFQQACIITPYHTYSKKLRIRIHIFGEFDFELYVAKHAESFWLIHKTVTGENSAIRLSFFIKN